MKIGKSTRRMRRWKRIDGKAHEKEVGGKVRGRGGGDSGGGGKEVKEGIRIGGKER